MKIKFNLVEVIIIMIITIVASITITIFVSFASKDTSKSIKTKAELSEFVNTYNTITNEYYSDLNKDELINAAIDGMLDYLDDPYSEFYDSKQTEAFNNNLNSEYKGIGIEITFNSEKKLIINKVFDESPAQKAGLKSKDIISKINDLSVENKTLSEIASLIKDEKQEEIKLVILRDNKEKIVTVKKSNVNIPSVNYEIIEENNKKIAKIDISTFATNTYQQFNKIYNEVSSKKIDGIILDLRGNTGGYLTTATSILEMFLNKGDTMYRLETKGKVTNIINKKDRIIDKKVVILVNKTTASASEILTSSLNENLGSDIVGVTTYGKGKVQKTKQLSNGTMIKYTFESWLTSKGKEIDKKGIEPTVVIELNKDYYKNPIDKNDNQLKKAIELLTKS